MNFQAIKAFIDERVNALDEMPLIEFFREIREIEIPDLEPKFMEFFLDIALKKGFVVDHHKLVEYGICKSGQSNHVLERIRTNELVEEIDYELGIFTDIREKSQEARVRPSTVYKFTNAGFKTLLMGARRYPGKRLNESTMNWEYSRLAGKTHRELESVYQSYISSRMIDSRISL